MCRMYKETPRYNYPRPLPTLVEGKTLRKVSVYADTVKKKANGDTICRLVILAVIAFLTVQLYAKHKEEQRRIEEIRLEQEAKRRTPQEHWVVST